MNKFIKVLVAGAITLLAGGSASAHGKVRVYTEVRPYHPALVQEHYGPAPAYYDDRFGQVRPEWEARREWRREQWRRAQWRREQWRRAHGHHGHHGHWRHSDRCRHYDWRY